MKIENIIKFELGSNKVIISDLFYKDTDVDMDYRNCIYRIKNLVNGKSYIGQSKNLFDRFRYSRDLSHRGGFEEGNQNLLYKALRKYGLNNFEVSVLDYDVFPELLNYLEKYWIKELHTCIYDQECWGYNMTWGGEDCSHMRIAAINKYPDTNGASPEFIEAGHKALKELYPDTNGACPQWWESGNKRMKELYPEYNGFPDYVIDMGHKALKEKYPDTNGIPPQMIEAGHEALLKKYPDTNGMPPQIFEASHSPETEEKRRATLIKRYGSVTGHLQKPEIITKAANGCSVTKLFQAIENNIRYLKDNNIELTFDNYLECPTNIERHLSRVRDKFYLLINDSRWTDDMESIFKPIKKEFEQD